MTQETVPGSPGSEDPDAMAAQLLSQFSGLAAQRISDMHETRNEERLRGSQSSKRNELVSSSFEVIVPMATKPSDYKYLPGHFTVNRILKMNSDNIKNPLYTVRLQSGERQTMTFDQFMQLENSTEALDRFNPDSNPEDDPANVETRGSVRSRRSLRKVALTGDGAGSTYEDSESSGLRSSRRSRRGATTSGQYTSYFAVEAESEESDDSESSTDELSARPNTRRNLRRKANHNSRASSSTDNRRNHIEGTRKSSRRLDSRKSMRERHEDDVSEVESTRSRQQKYTGAREVFQELSRDNDFRQRHFACCSTCNYYEDDDEKGLLVFCQGCSSSYHQLCLGPRASREHLVTKIDEGNFVLQCRRCLGMSHVKHDIRPHLGYCAVCREAGAMSEPLRERLTSKEEQQQRLENGGTDPVTSIDMTQADNPDNVLFRCTSCQRGFHVEHLPPMNETDASENFNEYSIHWQCPDCAKAPGEIEALLAWRPIQSQVNATKNVSLAELVPEIDKEYLIKWKTKSYFRATWMRGDWVWGHSNHAMIRAFYKSSKSGKPTPKLEDAIPEDNLRVDIIFDVSWSPAADSDEDMNDPEMVKEAFVKFKGLNYEDSVWEVPPQSHETERWENFVSAFEDWRRRDTVKPPNRQTLKLHFETLRKFDFGRQLLLDSQPELMTSGELMDYQLEGINWLYYMLISQQNAILADDMGLGKTVQVIGLIATLIKKHACWPFLVVVPNSTVPNWRREIKKWTPGVQVVTYFGSVFARKMANEQEMFPNGSRDLRCHVVIVSYESMVDDEARRVLNRIQWAGLIVDEGQRLKNDKTNLYERLSRMKFDFKVLLTGTPLQNNIRELFNLIQFLDPEKNADALEEEYGDLTSENIRALHKMIQPFFLRRTKAEVLPFLPPMVQIIVPVSMSVVQKKLYKSILGKNPQLIKAICQQQTGHLKRQERHNLNNILMQLRKCLCHPFVYSREIEEVTNDPTLAHQRLVEASGKFQLLNLMLPKLRDRGNRVLIFSQFLENLDMVEDLLTGMELRYCRLDGKLSAREKQQQIDKFNAPESSYFAFLLSTRSGGVGINLATADTVIIMDPDFNPKQDMQALSRAHRIGQQKTVLVYHLTTPGSVEEKIMERGKKKMALDHVLIDRMEEEEDDTDLESILRHGAAALFNDDDPGDHSYDSESMDKLLDRSQVEKAEKVAHDDANPTEGPRFSFARVWQKDRNTLEEVGETEDLPVDSTVWEKILLEREQGALEEASRKAETLGRGKRKRPRISYGTREEEANDFDDTASPLNLSLVKIRKIRDGPGSDFELQADDYAEETDSDPRADAMEIHGLTPPKKGRPFKRVEYIPSLGQLDLGLDGTSDCESICIGCNRRHPSGQCPVKAAGVENCPLCGLAHFGGRRICPHLHSKIQIDRMMDALRKSNEPRELVSAAKKYLKGIIGNLAMAERKASGRHSLMPDTTSTPPSSVQSPSLQPLGNPQQLYQAPPVQQAVASSAVASPATASQALALAPTVQQPFPGSTLPSPHGGFLQQQYQSPYYSNSPGGSHSQV
ncbi:hypothetical protein N7478_006470 [Penicillium angulare]|uniref:uncharacterized protein n=1 Tax=Penicillium angulare TaxID=116970 RepID=UPI0025409D7D|nr:uncharacterized protein N7478_006470 [Penicillium angulare]KAJ5281098.1 hypothetical protein N7478_006470 [Penicillium angulare]